MTDPKALRKKRWGASLVLAVGLAASIAANVLQAQPTVAGYIIAAWPPVCLLLALELMTRVLIGDGKLTKALTVATVAIAGIAFWVSYWHMVETALEHGETTVSAHALPFTVDLLVAVSIGCLVALSRLMRDTEVPTPVRSDSGPEPAPEHPELVGMRKEDAVRYALRESEARTVTGVREWLAARGVEVSKTTAYAVIGNGQTSPERRPELVAVNGKERP